MNKYLYKDLKEVLGTIKSVNVKDQDQFDYFIKDNICDQYENNVLYFLTDQTIKLLSNLYNEHKSIPEIVSDNNNATFVIEKNMENIFNGLPFKYIMVSDVNNSINQLYNYALKQSKAEIIGVAGLNRNVTSDLLKQVLSSKFNILKLNSDFNQWDIINYLTSDTEYIILNYQNDNRLLKPDIGIILNKNILPKEQIIEQSKVLNSTKVGYVNKYDPNLNRIKLSDGTCYYGNTKLFKNKRLRINKVNMERVIISNTNFLINNTIFVEPYSFDDIARLQYLICYLVAQRLGVSPLKFASSVKDYQPQLEEEKNNQFIKRINK